MSVFLGLCIHVAFLVSIFDIYFKSPIVTGVEPFKPLHDAPADRLVLFVADGLRAESLLNYSTMPYLRSVASTRGRWGISNTRVPTESRPGHVAIIAGFYEDPSAVAKGWKKNPVDFDSVFNQSRFTWCWGADEILDIFSNGESEKHILVDAYNTNDQTFSTNDNTTLLDAWVFEKVKAFFNKAKIIPELNKQLKKDKLVFFLHLLGTDTSGHTHKPNSPDFVTNVRFVDEGIKRMESLFNEFYGHDNKTTFLMTSDHGMTDWGSHGAGDKHETETPYIIWGAGVDEPEDTQNSLIYGLPVNRRHDINQADLAPLMSTIISAPVPVNSIGQLPDVVLDMSVPNRAKAVYGNSRQLAAQYNRTRLRVEENALSLLYYPFEPLSKKKLQEIVDFSEQLLVHEQFEKLILVSEEIISLSLSGLVYYYNYYQGPLLTLISLSFIGWNMYLFTILIVHKKKTNVEVNTENFNKRKHSRSKSLMYPRCINTIFAVLCLSFFWFVYAQKLPEQYYIYSFIPLFLWWKVLLSADVWIGVAHQIYREQQHYAVLTQVTLYVIGIVALVNSFTYRWMLSIPLYGMAVWPFFSAERKHLPWPLLLFWGSSCTLLGLFSYLPVVGKEVYVALVLLAGVIWLLVYVLYAWKVMYPLYLERQESKNELAMAIIQIAMLLVSLHNVYVQGKRFEEKTPVVSAHQTVAWVVGVTSPILPALSSTRQVCRLFAVNTSLLTFYLMLSVSHEGLFLVILLLNLVCWLLIEFKLSHSRYPKVTDFTFTKKDRNIKEKQSDMMAIERSLSQHDFRRAFFFLLYIILSFFGTGNIASLNSFEVRWVTCFVTSFRPFVITTLILLKTMVPFLSVACTFHAISLITKAPTGYLIIIVLIFSNMMGLQMLYYVKNTGSWLEIGTSISQYVIVQLITLFIVILHKVAKIITELNAYSFNLTFFKSRKKYL